MNRPKQREVVVGFSFIWPRQWMMRLSCWLFGHEDVWGWRYLPHVARCKHCLIDLADR